MIHLNEVLISIESMPRKYMNLDLVAIYVFKVILVP